MTKSKKILIWIIVVLIASILLGLAVRVGMYYYEYRQDSKLLEFFKENVPKNGVLLNTFCEALRNGETETIEKCLCDYLRRAISIRDTFVRKKMKENFYHGILLGILGYEESWSVSSNKESGDGYTL